jgi:acetolactate synthase-1/2/3 large subunit
MKVTDYIAQFFKNKGVDMTFAVTGSGSIRLIESFEQLGIDYLCPHQEQAGIMAALTRMRITGNPAVMMVTGGPGASNTLIGLADAHLDSMPLFILAGQENLEYVDPPNEMRGKGVQGLDMVDITKTVTKFGYCLTDPKQVKWMLEKAFHLAYSGRPGPVWIEVPQNLQHTQIDPDTLIGYTPDVKPEIDYMAAAKKTVELIKKSQRPLFWLGHGVRIAKGIDVFCRVQSKLNMPSLVTWPAADILTDEDPNFAGRAGTYGQRFGNLALQNCDLLITLGTRVALPQRGFNDATFSRGSKKVIVDIDPIELNKFKFNIDVPVEGDVAKFLEALDKTLAEDIDTSWSAWREKINHWKKKYPMATPPEDPNKEGINSYWFIENLSKHLTSNHTIITDMGTALTCTHAAIKLKPGQRLITSTGLGEMGFGLPGAIGACLADSKRDVVLIVGEGSFMMNLQELQTMKENNLNIKVFLLNNNGYLTIKHTHNAIYKSAGNAGACGPKSGVTFPDFKKVIEAFGFSFKSIATPLNLDNFVNEVIGTTGPIFAEIIMPEFQELIPKSAIKTRPDGTIYSSPLEDLYPFLSREELESEMIVPLLPE